MAPSLIIPALLSLALTFSCACQGDLINKICAVSEQPALCKKTLTSEPRSRGADLPTLGDICIDKALPPTQLAKNLSAKYGFDSCVEDTDTAVEELEDCRGFLKVAHDPFNISTLKITATGAFIDIENCIDIHGEEMPADLKKASGSAMDQIRVLLAVVSFF